MNTAYVEQICATLFKNTPIKHFGYCRVFKEGSYYALSNFPSWIEHFYYAQYAGPGYDGKDYQDGFQFGQNLLNIGLTRECIIDMKTGFNLYNVISYVENNLNYYDMYMLATPRLDKNCLSFYLSNTDILKKFFAYFKEAASDLIVEASASKIILPSKFQTSFHIDDSGTTVDNYYKMKRQILKYYSFDIVRFYKEHGGKKLSYQELSCLSFIIRGMTSKMIGKKMGISPRTVECYLENLKNKFKVFSKLELIDNIITHIFDNL